MTAGTEAHAKPRSLKHRVAHEAIRFFWIFLYLWVLFGLFVLNERIILGQRGIGFASQGFALVNAFVLAKVMLVAEDLKFGGWFCNRPLVVPIVADSALFAALFLVTHILEEVIVGLIHGHSAVSSVPAIGQGGIAGAITVSVILFVALLPYFSYMHLGRIIGPERLRGWLLKSPESFAHAPQGNG
ncbi:MAG: hypothetical protein JSR21_01110 [Proteobacteria bacterium]|nr:hypothetical protein [Pseudomonadota bacterium]